MIVDCDRHVGVRQLADLLPNMSTGWRRHFEREEWLGATGLMSSHIRLDDHFHYDVPAEPPSSDGLTSLLLPYQALTIAGWADQVAGRAFVAAINQYGLEHWVTPTDRVVLAVSPHDPAWSATEIRRLAATAGIGAVALPLTSTMLGSRQWDPIYQACTDANLPLVVHFSGVEGNYAGAPALSGGVHQSAFARLALMPHVAESNITSLAFEGAFARFPELRILFSGFGFTWLPSLLWRMDREWRTFRHDVPWVTAPPSQWVGTNLWFTTWPLGEAADREHWEGGFTDTLRTRIVFGSHAPHANDDLADADRLLGKDWAKALTANGAGLLGLTTVEAR
jgi:predicted TIM-barrel fold metal-dependent hydrolase